MQKLKLYFLYHKGLMGFSLPFSLLVGLVGMAFSPEMATGFVNGFSLSLLTGGFILALYFYEQRYRHQYYFYHNLGISKAWLILGSYFFNLALAFLLFTLKIYLHA